MNNMRKAVNLAAVAALSLLASTSCLTVNDREGFLNDGSAISFVAKKDNEFTKAAASAADGQTTVSGQLRISNTLLPMTEPATKTDIVGSNDDLKSGVIGMYIYECPELDSPAAQATMHTNYPIHVEYNSVQGLWVPREYQRWSTTDGCLRFFAWYPFSLVTPDASDAAAPVFDYTTPEDISHHKDLLVSETVTVADSPSGYPVTLNFRHVLSGIRFAVKHGLSLGSVSISGIYDSGQCDMSTGQFTNLTSEGNSYQLTSPSMTQDGTYDYLDMDSIMLLLPQTMPAGAALSVTIDGNSYTADLEGRTIPAGRILVFKLDIDDDVFTFGIDRDVLAFDYQGNPESASSVNVTSTKTHGTEITYPGWNAEVYDGSQWISLTSAVLQPEYSWLSSITSSMSAPSSTSTGINVSVPARTVTSHEARLKSNRILDVSGSGTVDNSVEAGAVDLSRYDFVSNRMEAQRYTANCYVVSSPGWYEFPLVYGNAIENDATAEKSYKGKLVVAGHLDGFKNYKHNLNIADPWIEQDWAAWLISRNHVETANILWERYTRFDGTLGQTVTEGRRTGSPNMGVITNISLVTGEDGRYIRFYVSPENIRPGNAVIAAYDAGGDTEDDEGETGALIMWSWHIWITDQPMDTRTVSNTNGSWDVLPVNIGWIDDTEGTYYAPRQAQVRFVCAEDQTVISETLTVIQREHEEESVSGWGTYYQWGRKDPFADGLYTYKPNYDTGIRGSIRHPDWFNSEVSTYFSSQYYDWATNNYNNLWDSQCSDYGSPTASLPDHKTVMDPSPRRFSVSPDYTWEGFSMYGYKGSFNNGYHFYTDSSQTETIFFPATGHITYSGVVASSSDNRYWTTRAWASLQRRASYGLRFNSSAVQTCYYTDNHRAIGEAVRPVRYN